MRQLLLPLLPDPPPTLDNFATGRNAEALAALVVWLDAGNPEVCLLLWGEPGSGRSHLLHATGGTYVDAATDPGLATLPPEALRIAVDNVEALDADGQIVLFNTFNRLRAAGGKLLVAASQAPAHLALREDLRTRLGWGLIQRLHPLSDAEKRSTLAERAAERGMRLPADALDYLLLRAPRDMRTLTALIDTLDRYSLEQQRPITTALLRSVLHAEGN